MSRGLAPVPLVALAQRPGNATVEIYPGVTEALGPPAESLRLMERLAAVTPNALPPLSWAP